MDQPRIATDDRPLLQRVIEFPLVTMLIAITLVMIALTAAGLIGAAIHAAAPRVSYPMATALVALPLLLGLYKLAIRYLGEAPRDDLPACRALTFAATGVGAGLVVFSIAVAIAAAIGVYRVTGEGGAGGLADALVISAIFPALSEEMLFRGIIFRWLEEWGGSWAGLALSSLAFGFVHYFNPGATALACLCIAIEAGLMLGAAYMLTRSLWLPMGIHAGWNFAQGEIYDIPVSGLPVHGLLKARLSGPPLLTGGDFGLEASLIAVVLATAVGVWLVALAIRRGQLVQPIWVRRRDLSASPARD